MVCAKTVVIAGPTASGKSELALNLAAAIGGKIINADRIKKYLKEDFENDKAILKKRVSHQK